MQKNSSQKKYPLLKNTHFSFLKLKLKVKGRFQYPHYTQCSQRPLGVAVSLYIIILLCLFLYKFKQVNYLYLSNSFATYGCRHPCYDLNVFFQANRYSDVKRHIEWQHEKKSFFPCKVNMYLFKNIFIIHTTTILYTMEVSHPCIITCCLFVLKDLSHRRTVIILLYKLASHGPWEGFNYFVGGYHHPLKRIWS